MEFIIIPNTVTSIGDGAFIACGGLESVMMPNSVTDFGNGVFSSCSNLSDISISEDNQYLELIDGAIFSKLVKALNYYPQAKK